VKILVVDDIVTNVSILRANLVKMGHEVVTARDGIEAGCFLEKEAVDIVMTDWLMPKRNGVELVQWIRSTVHPVPIIVMVTALGSREAQIQAIEAGVDEYLVKPIVLKDIHDVLEGLEQRKNQHMTVTLPPSLRLEKKGPIPFPGVAIVAGTGGATSLRSIIKGFDHSVQAAFFIVLHGPGWASETLAEIMQQESVLDVRMASHGCAVVPGTVYVAPEDGHMILTPDGKTIHIVQQPPENYLRPAADPLFRSLAEAYGKKAIGVVLAGTSCDGAVGCGYIKVAQGAILIQRPTEAVSSQMPKNILSFNLQDAVLPVEQIAGHVQKMLGTFGIIGQRETSVPKAGER
jgi:two-component system chemotaxis response regulator CheB